MKKILALVLAVMLVVGMAPMAFAADAPTGLGISTNSVPSLLGDINPDRSDIKLPIIYSNGVQYDKTTIAKDKITMKTKVTAGSKVLKEAKIKYENIKTGTFDSEGKEIIKANQAYINIEFADDFVSTGSLDFEFSVYLLKDKNRLAETETTFSGTLKNISQKVDSKDDYVYSYDVPVVEAEEYVKAIKFDIGSDVIISAKLFEGKKYYGKATTKVKSSDDATFTQYPDIDTVYYVNTIGLNSSGNTVKIDINDKLFVYNADMEYIGTTADNLPYSTKYFVASKELDVESTEETAPETSESSTASNPNMGGNDAPANTNDNPGTGR